MLLYVNSIVEGSRLRSIYSGEPIVQAGLGSLLRLHKMAGRSVHEVEFEGVHAFKVLHPTGELHAIHWLSPSDEGANTLLQ